MIGKVNVILSISSYEWDFMPNYSYGSAIYRP